MTRAYAVFLSAAVAVLAAASGAQAAGDIARGRATAIQDCAACHKVTATQPQPPAVMDKESGLATTAPTFTAIGLKYAGNAQGLRAFVHLPRYPMPAQEHTPSNLDDLAAYILSLHSDH
jgi:mono/diheme cytochrome c family protein